MTQYLLAVHHDYDGPQPPEAELQQMYADTEKVNDELRAAGVWVFGGGLLHPSSATVVRAEGTADATMTDGPYTETKEALGGFWVLDLKDLDEALAWAEKASRACRGAIEVRPFEGDAG